MSVRFTDIGMVSRRTVRFYWRFVRVRFNRCQYILLTSIDHTEVSKNLADVKISKILMR